MRTSDKEKLCTVRRSEIFYYLFWVIMLFAKGTGLYEGMRQYNICLVMSMLCLGISLVLTSFRVVELIWMSILVLFGGWIYWHSGDQSAFILVAVMIGLKNKKLSRVFKIGAVVWGGCFVYMVLRTLIGAGNPGPVLAHEKLGLGPVLRWSLGYTHPNVLQITYVILSCFILYIWNLRPGRRQWKITCCLMLGNLYVFLYSVSFTGFLFMLLLLVLNMYLQKRSHFTKIEELGLQAVFPAGVLFSLAGPLVLDKETRLFDMINRALNSRFLATRVYLEEMGVTLWGMRISVLNGFAVDCSYTEALLSYGSVFFACLVIGYLFTIHDMVKRKRRKELAIMLSLLVAGISEPFLFNASFKNITVLFVGEYLFIWSAGISRRAAVMGKEIPFLSGWDKECGIPVGLTEKLGNIAVKTLRKYKISIWCVTAAACLVCGALGAKFAWQPDSIFVGIASTDCADQEEKYLDAWNLPEGFNSAVYEYVSPEEPLYEFKGNMLKVEYGRKIVSAGVWGAVGTVIVYLATMAALDRKRAEKRKHMSR